MLFILYDKIAVNIFFKKGGEDIKYTHVPIYNSIKEYTKKNPTIFHMPGHKLGKGFPNKLVKNLVTLDITEIPGTDNLHHPKGAIKKALLLAADAFGAENTFFLVNGSTCGIHAMIMSVCKPGDRLIIGRDCHKSVLGGLILARAEPIYIKPEFNQDFNISTVISPEEIQRCIRDNPDAVGVLITRPNYYGICSNITEIAKIVHSYGKVLMVDEAHGAHFRFNNRLPVCAMDAGADICVQSAHKTLPALTQGAYLHVKSTRIDIERLRFNLDLIQTSSPSYILMSYLDIARYIMNKSGKYLLDSLINNVAIFSNELEKINTMRVLNTGKNDMDNTRLVINVANTGNTGYFIEKKLRLDHNIQVEMSDFYNIICICTISDRRKEFKRLYKSLKSLALKFTGSNKLITMCSGQLPIPDKKMSLYSAIYRKSAKVTLKDAKGLAGKNTITPYPPGIPLVCPGEIISEEIIVYIYDIIDKGGTVIGIDDDFKIEILN